VEFGRRTDRANPCRWGRFPCRRWKAATVPKAPSSDDGLSPLAMKVGVDVRPIGRANSSGSFAPFSDSRRRSSALRFPFDLIGGNWSVAPAILLQTEAFRRRSVSHSSRSLGEGGTQRCVHRGRGPAPRRGASPSPALRGGWRGKQSRRGSCDAFRGELRPLAGFAPPNARLRKACLSPTPRPGQDSARNRAGRRRVSRETLRP
jgi:hypothetical protein